jgi:hypothetical protein
MGKKGQNIGRSIGGKMLMMREEGEKIVQIVYPK